MTKIKIWTLPFVILCLYGCSASGPKYSGIPNISNEESILFVYRESKFLKSATYPFVYVNGEELGPLRNGGFVAKNIPKGENTVEIKGRIFPGDWMPDPIKVNIDAEGGKPVFLKMWFGGVQASVYPGNIFSTTTDVSVGVVPKGVAEKEIKSLNYSD